MKIEITDDNGMINNGVPTLVVLVIDGKTRIPYEATKTIQDVYRDVQKLSEKNIEESSELPIMYLDEVFKKQSEVKSSVLNNEIEREDIVKLVKLHERDPGSDSDLVVGNEYRILDIKKKNKQVVQYDVLDDNADMKIRIHVFPDEVELVRKHKILPKRSTVPDMIKKCGVCREENALLKVGDGEYEGVCEKCGAKLIEIVGAKNA